MDLRIGRVHGELTPQRKDAEQNLRNDIFFAGRLQIVAGRKKTTMLRVVAYEMPLAVKGRPRRNCLDLLAYDGAFRPYLIEVKRDGAKDKPDAVCDQINEYARLFESIRGDVQQEIRDVFLWPKFAFQGKAERVILAPRGFYNTHGKADWIQATAKHGIHPCYLSGQTKTLRKRTVSGVVNIHIVK